MLIEKLKIVLLRGALAGGLCAALAGTATAEVVTTSFQNGANGYMGTFDRRISDRQADEMDGATIPSYYLDGFKTDLTSPDAQGLIRFDDIIGDGEGQIPAGAAILSAELTVTTSLAGNAHTSGPFGVSGLLQPFDSTTSYFVNFSSTTDLGSRGAWWQDGSATRPTGGYGRQLQGASDSADVTAVVQSWADGEPAYGFVIQAGLADTVLEASNTADGWSIRTTGYLYADTRPKLTVTYTTTPVQANSFQEGTEGYAGTTMAIVRSGANALIEDTDNVDNPEITIDASTLDQVFLDGIFFSGTDGSTSSPDNLALLKFENVFGTEAGQAPADVPVAKAWVVMTTGNTSNDCQSIGPWSIHTMKRPWDMTTLHSSFGEVNGLQVGDGDISPMLDVKDGIIRGAEVWFDVTEYIEGVRTGADNYGVAIQGDGTADGWQIHATGSTEVDARPRLIVFSADLSGE